MKNKKRFRKLEAKIDNAVRLLNAICKHLGISVRLSGVDLASFDGILKELYPANVPMRLAGVPSVHPDREELDKEARVARAEEIAAKMFADKPKENIYETIVQSIEFKEEPKEAKVRIPPSLELGF